MSLPCKRCLSCGQVLAVRTLRANLRAILSFPLFHVHLPQLRSRTSRTWHYAAGLKSHQVNNTWEIHTVARMGILRCSFEQRPRQVYVCIFSASLPLPLSTATLASLFASFSRFLACLLLPTPPKPVTPSLKQNAGWNMLRAKQATITITPSKAMKRFCCLIK